MAEFTFLKIQLDESSFTANAPFSGGDTEEAEADPEPETTEGGGSRATTLLAVVAGLLALAAVAFVVVKRRGSAGAGPEAETEEDELVELDDIDV